MRKTREFYKCKYIYIFTKIFVEKIRNSSRNTIIVYLKHWHSACITIPMNRSTKFFLNYLFIIFTFAGFFIIFFNDTIEHALALFIPAAMVLLYLFLVGTALNNCNDYQHAEHQIDRGYSLGFLYTLISIVAFFYRVKDFAGLMPDQLVLAIAFIYLTISITSSIAGIVFGNIVLKNYKKNQYEKTYLQECRKRAI